LIQVPRRSEIAKERILSKVALQLNVDVTTNGHYTNSSTTGKNEGFKVVFTKTYPVVLRITNVDYQIAYGGKLLQKESWKGVLVLDERILRASVFLLYRPLESQLTIPGLRSGWTVTGKATIECKYGTFEKLFDSNILEVYSNIS
jgi:hypothetical protein